MTERSGITRRPSLPAAAGASLATIATHRWTGLQTAVVVDSTGRYFQAVALDANGTRPGTFPIICPPLLTPAATGDPWRPMAS